MLVVELAAVRLWDELYRGPPSPPSRPGQLPPSMTEAQKHPVGSSMAKPTSSFSRDAFSHSTSGPCCCHNPTAIKDKIDATMKYVSRPTDLVRQFGPGPHIIRSKPRYKSPKIITTAAVPKSGVSSLGAFSAHSSRILHSEGGIFYPIISSTTPR